jgi:hypothetical protein
MDCALENSAIFDSELEALYYPLGRPAASAAPATALPARVDDPVLVEDDELSDGDLGLLPTIIRAPVPDSESSLELDDDEYDDLELYVESDDDDDATWLSDVEE